MISNGSKNFVHKKFNNQQNLALAFNYYSANTKLDCLSEQFCKIN